MAPAELNGMPQDTAFQTLKSFMFETSGNVIKEDQSYLLEARLTPLMRQFGYESMERMVKDAYHGKNQSLARSILDAMTTHETQFFRDAKFWADLCQTVVAPAAARLNRGLRIWSAGCSTGQEAYSLAMLLEERFPKVASKTQIYATDVSSAAVETARAALYSEHETSRGLDAARLARHFERATSGVRVKKAISSRVQFSVHNLKDASPFSSMDLVLCRNVLIYFSEVDRWAIVDRLTRALGPEALLVLGSTESLPGIKAILPGCYERQSLGTSKAQPMQALALARRAP